MLFCLIILTSIQKVYVGGGCKVDMGEFDLGILEIANIYTFKTVVSFADRTL